MEPASNMPLMPFQKTLRSGQQEVVDLSVRPNITTINAQLPTGYGKTLAATCTYSALQQIGRVNRMLYVVPTTAQLVQFVKDGSADLVDAGVSGPLGVTDITYFGARSIKHHRENKAQVFAVTIQALASGNAWDVVTALMETGRWMLVIDEYHHYGLDKHWGRQVSKLNYAFRLAMSATPYRPDDDGAFGQPDIIVPYLRAVEEKAVKPLRLHSYVYRIDLIEKDGGVVSYTTEQLAEEAGSDSPDAIDKMIIDRNMRWSPKYVSPLVDRPIARMQRERIRTGYPLQVLVGAMSCSHAELVCGQMRAMFPELRIDWVGTGMNGRTDKDNAEILSSFCPPKVKGRRRPTDIKLDVLVHVGMAGEGLDSIFVSEVVHLNRASINNSNNQENGRAARYLSDVIGYINVDSSSPYALYIGEGVMALMDDPNAKPGEEKPEIDPEIDPNYWPDIPDEPKIRIWDMECIRVDDGEVRKFGQEMLRASGGISENDIASIFENPSHPNYERWMRIAENGYREMHRKIAEQFNSKAETQQWEESVNGLVSTLTGQITKLISATGIRVEKSAIGDFKKRINSQKAKAVGRIERDIDVLKKHWYWLKGLEHDLRNGRIPPWLL
jgi:hypothetical protein